MHAQHHILCAMLLLDIHNQVRVNSFTVFFHVTLEAIIDSEFATNAGGSHTVVNTDVISV